MGQCCGKFSCSVKISKTDDTQEEEESKSAQNIKSVFKDINEKASQIAKELDEWTQIETDLLQYNPELIDLPDTYDAQLLSEHETFFRKLIHTISDAVLPVDEEIENLIARTSELLQQRFSMLNAACEIANDQQLSDRLRSKARMEICRDSMAILNDELALLNGVKEELRYCMDTEKLSEKIVGLIIDIVTFVLAKFSTPSTGFSLSKEYQNHLYNDVKNETQALLQIRTAIEHELSQAKEIAEPIEIQMQKSVEALPGKVAALMQGMFAPKKGEKSEEPKEKVSTYEFKMG